MERTRRRNEGVKFLAGFSRRFRAPKFSEENRKDSGGPQGLFDAMQNAFGGVGFGKKVFDAAFDQFGLDSDVEITARENHLDLRVDFLEHQEDGPAAEFRQRHVA